MVHSRKHIILLLGPKGSGKSFIGSLIQKHLGIPFLLVEKWLKDLRNNRDLDDKNYLEQVFNTIESGVRNELAKNDTVAFESTGLTPYFDQMLDRLQGDYNVTCVKVIADIEVCLERIGQRDASLHIPVTEEEILEINQQHATKNFNYHFEIVNEGKSEAELVDVLRELPFMR